MSATLPRNTGIIVASKPPEGVRIISNSEVDAFNTCKRKHLFSFIKNKEPGRLSRSLFLGVYGHELLAVFYKTIQSGGSKTQAYQATMRYLTSLFMSMPDDEHENLAYLQVLLKRYIEQETYSEHSEILAVEEFFCVPITDEFWYGLRLDLLIQHTKGRVAGEIELIDHKFTYDFYTVDSLKLIPQMPKYVGAVRYNGIRVKDATINQLRTRFSLNQLNEKSDEDLFRRQPVGVTDTRIKTSFSQQIKVSQKIIEHQKMSLEDQFEEAIPILNKMVCGNCPYKSPCQLMEEGADVNQYLELEFKPRSYGYNEET